jgi:hypothetical protein
VLNLDSVLDLRSFWIQRNVTEQSLAMLKIG